MRIIFVSISPDWTARIQLGDEMRELLRGLRGHDIELEMLPTARPEGLKAAISGKEIDILHISGHSAGTGPIVPEDADGSKLRDILESGQIKLAVLNAGGSRTSVDAIEDSVGAVIATSEVPEDDVAQMMLTILYLELGRNESIRSAFDEANKSVGANGSNDVLRLSGQGTNISLTAGPGSDEAAVNLEGQAEYDRFFFISYMDELISSLKRRVSLNRAVFWILFVLGVSFIGWMFFISPSAADRVDLMALLSTIFGQERINQYIGKPYLDSMIAIGAAIPMLLSFLQSRLTISSNQTLKSLTQLKELAKSSENLTPDIQNRLQKILDQSIRGADKDFRPLNYYWNNFVQLFRPTEKKAQ